jgi:hypothetical protein
MKRLLLVRQMPQAHSPDIEPDVLKNNAGAFSVSDAALTLPGALAAAKSDADAASKRVAEAVKSAKVPDDQHQGAACIWARAQRRLDSAKGVSEKAGVAQDLISGAEGLALGTLQEELPEYLASEGVPTDWLDNAFAARIPDAAAALAEANRLAKAHAILAHNHSSLTRAIDRDLAAPQLLDPTQAAAEPYTGG